MDLGSDLYGATFGPSQPVSLENGWFVRALGGGPTDAGITVSEYTAVNLPVVYACTNRIGNPIGRAPVKIFQRTAGGGRREVLEHPMSERLRLRPNDLMSSRTVRKTIQVHALLWGNGYLEIERNGRGQAVGLWPLMPDRTRPEREGENHFFRTTVDGVQYKLDPKDVIHVMDMSHDGLVGISPIANARQAVGMGLATEKFGAKFFANDLKAGGFLLHPGKLSSTARGNLGMAKGAAGTEDNPAAMVERQGGLDNAHRIKVLEEGMKFIQTTIPPEDAQFLATREFQIAEIARIYDVPLILLQSHEKTTSWGSGIEQLMIGFITQTIDPWVDAWEQELNWKLFTEEERAQGLFVKFNLNAYLRGDSAARAAFYKELFGLAGLTPNRILALEDEEPIGPEGDERFVSTGFQPLKTVLNPPDPPQAPAPLPPDDPEEP